MFESYLSTIHIILYRTRYINCCLFTNIVPDICATCILSPIYADDIINMIINYKGVLDIMPVSKAQQRAVSKYMKDNYDEFKIRLPKGSKEIIKSHVEANNESINSFIYRLIKEAIPSLESLRQ